jgi:hypothetical protein
VLIAFLEYQLLQYDVSIIFSSWLSAHGSLCTEIPYNTVLKFIATLDIPPLIVVNKQGLYVVVCIQIHVGNSVATAILDFNILCNCVKQIFWNPGSWPNFWLQVCSL